MTTWASVLAAPRLTRAGRPMVDGAVTASSWAIILVGTNITTEFKRSGLASWAMVAVACVATLFVMSRRGSFAGPPALPRTDEISSHLTSTLVGASAIAVLAAFADWHIGAWEIVSGGALVLTSRTLAQALLRTAVADSGRAKVIVVGTGDDARQLVDLITDHRESGFVLAGVVGELSQANCDVVSEKWIGPASRLIPLMSQHDATHAIVTATGFSGDQIRQITGELFRTGYDVYLATGVTRTGVARFDVRSLAHEPLIVWQHNSIRRSHLVAKRATDIVGALILITLASGIMLATSALIWIKDGRPVTYTSQRTGRRGQIFRMYKFRSMVEGADQLKKSMEGDNERTGPLFKLSDDPRVTRIGRFIRETSIDELPQLFNVLRGDMSLVGPRPALPEEEAAFDDELRNRAGVRPGITGLWQVEARSNAAFNAYRRLDLHYVENWSFALDLRILLATVEQVLVSLMLLPFRLFKDRMSIDSVDVPRDLVEATTSTTGGRSVNANYPSPLTNAGGMTGFERAKADDAGPLIDIEQAELLDAEHAIVSRVSDSSLQ